MLPSINCLSPSLRVRCRFTLGFAETHDLLGAKPNEVSDFPLDPWKKIVYNATARLG